MKRYLCILTIAAILPWDNACSAQAVDSAKVINTLNTCWRAISHEFASIYGLEEEEIKRYTKQQICFTKDSITMYSGVLYAPTYSIKKVNAENYTKENFDCSKQRLYIYSDSVFEVTISSVTKPSEKGTVHKMTNVIVFDEDCIYVVVDGVIFKLFNASRKVERRSAN
jgi:hypothetical protein